MQATYSNPKPAHKNSRKIQSVQEPLWAFWSVLPLNYSDPPPQHLWRRVILKGRVSCCGRIVSFFTLSLFSCWNWHWIIVLLGQHFATGSTWDKTNRCSPGGQGPWTDSKVAAGGTVVDDPPPPHSPWPFPLSSRLWPDNVLLAKNGVINHQTVSDVILQTLMYKNRAEWHILLFLVVQCWLSQLINTPDLRWKDTHLPLCKEKQVIKNTWLWQGRNV